VTDGTETNVPASYGQWPGYRTTKASAWVIKIGADVWLARCGKRAGCPGPFNEARVEALRMVRGEWFGDALVGNPILNLNLLAASCVGSDEMEREVCGP